jgi:hypothetical protein
MARGGGKVDKNWVELEYDNSDSVNANNLAFDSSTSIKVAIQAIGGGGGYIRDIEYFTLNATDITRKYITLSHTPINDEIQFVVIEGPTQVYGVDFIRKETTKISWSTVDTSEGLESDLRTLDIIQIEYTRGS